jgi:alkylhydroperoxidase family enzyme
MARVPYLSEADLAPADRDLLARKLNLYRALAHSPDGARAFAAPALYVRHHSPLDPRLRELAILQVGYLTRTTYEYAHHIELGRTVGVTDDDLRALAAETAGRATALPALDRAVMRAARELAAQPRLSDETFAALRAGLDHRQVVDLVITIATYCGVVRLLGALEIDLEPGYEALLEAFPLPPA